MGRLALLLALAAALTAPAAAAADRLDVVFTGSGNEHYTDEQRWVSLTDNECYLRKTIDQSATLSWTLGWTVPLTAKSRVPASATAAGQAAGSEVGDFCDADEAPADAPDNWVHTTQCGDQLTATANGSLTASVKAGRLVLQLSGPTYALPANATCALRPRSSELQARVVVKLASLKQGKTLTVPLGTARPAYGAYIPHQNCMNAAKPYEGYRSFDACGDDLSWSGTLQITRRSA